MRNFRLIPQEERFFISFKSMADELRVASDLLLNIVSDEVSAADKARQVRESEHKCDFLTHEILERLIHWTFGTPLDREDVHSVARALDEIMNAIDDVASLIPLTDIGRIRPAAKELASILRLQTGEVGKAIDILQKRKSAVLVHSVEINRLENEAAGLHRKAIDALFKEERDFVVVLRLKEILDLLKNAACRCEGMATLLENVVVKQGWS